MPETIRKYSENRLISSLTVLFLLLNLLSLQGCLQQDTVGDTTQQEINRQKGMADAIESEYDQIKGQFIGSFNNSTVLLTLGVGKENTNGSGLVPQPNLVGNLSLSPQLFVNNGGEPLTIPFAVTAGQYSDGDDLTLTVQENGQNGNPTTLLCEVQKLNTLNCDWYINAGTAPKVSFSLVRVGQGEPLSSRPGQFGGTYVGSNADYSDITAQFRPFLEPQGGSSSVPQVSIVGSFAFDGVSFSFIDSQYDPVSSTIAIRINGDNPIEVNCVIRSASALHCTWIGRHGATSYEEFDLNKAS